MMIDYVSGFIEPRNIEGLDCRLYDTGRVLRLSPGGEVDFETSGACLLEGSHDSRLLVRSPNGTDLYLSGNPVKHIQGHNLWGPDDPAGLFFDAGVRVREALGLFPSPGTWHSLGFVGPRFTRLDFTRSYRFPSAAEARAWLRDVGSVARTRHGAPNLKQGTIYFGQGSERWTFKLYHKGDEVASNKKGHALLSWLRGRDKLLEWAQGVVRFELMLRSKELEKIDIEQTAPLEVWERYYERITWNQNAMATSPDLMESTLPPRLQTAVIAWRSGADLRAIYTKPTFYRCRREIQEALGIDIASPPVVSDNPPQSAELDPKGWDPEPLEVYPGDLAELKRQYRLT
jgi:II/X family phage/plasmid replication protein